MRYFARLLLEMREMVETQRPGKILEPPSLLSRTEIEGRRLTYFQMGLANTARPVILLHGFGGFFMDWPRVMGPLAKNHHVFALDLPGWGFSEPNPHARGMENDAKVVSEFIQKLNLKNVVLAGLSYGAGVAWAASALHIPNVKHIVLINPMPPHPIRFMKSTIYKGIFHMNRHLVAAKLGHKLMTKAQFKLICQESLLHRRLLDSFYLDISYAVVKQPHIAGILHTHARGAFNVDWNNWAQRLQGVEIPTTILQGMNDRVFSLESAKYLHGLIPGSRLIEVDRCGHAMVFDQHSRITDTIENEAA